MTEKNSPEDNKSEEIYQTYISQFLIKDTVNDYDTYQNINKQTRKNEKYFFRKRILGWLTTFFEIRAMELMLSLTNGGIILDVPCGTGKLFKMIKNTNNYESIIGIDASTMMIQKNMETNGIDLNLIYADIRYLPIKSRVIDTVVCNRFFHRFPLSYHNIALQELRRICKQNLIVYFSVKPLLLRLIVGIEMTFHFGDRGSIHYLSINQIKDEIITDGFNYFKEKNILPLLSNGYLIMVRRNE